MKYLQLICIEGETGTPEAAASMRDNVGPWVEDTVARHINVVGKPLDQPETARTVRVRDGETLISDGPFIETKEFIGGLDILECENLDEAIDVASKHPVSWFHAIELRPFRDGSDIPNYIDSADLQQLLLVCVDGSPKRPRSRPSSSATARPGAMRSDRAAYACSVRRSPTQTAPPRSAFATARR